MSAYVVRPRPLTVTQGDWWKNAACKGESPDLFFSEPGEDAERHRVRVREAKAVCDGCPVRKDCLAWAQEHETAGVWGGHDFDGRAKGRTKKVLREFHCSRCREIVVFKFGGPLPDSLLCEDCLFESGANDEASRRRRVRVKARQ